MSWVIDTCVVIDVLENDPAHGLASARLLQRLLPGGLVVAPVTMVELSPAFGGDLTHQKTFLQIAGVAWDDPWTLADTERAHPAWHAYIAAKRLATTPKRPVADILIGAYASNRTGLVTRNAADFRRWFPRLKVREP